MRKYPWSAYTRIIIFSEGMRRERVSAPATERHNKPTMNMVPDVMFTDSPITAYL